jgi:hypothetical protein
MRGYIKLLVLFLSIVVASTNTATADSWGVSHSCSKPYKPYQFNSEYEYQNFLEEVETYKRCIQDFIEEQGNAVDEHSNAASEAIEEWNRFIKYELD